MQDKVSEKNIKNLDQLQLDRKSHFNELVLYMPFNDKVLFAKQRIKEFLEFVQHHTNHKEVIISFSGGKDSTVLLDLVLKVHKEMKSKLYLLPAYAYEITFPETLKFINSVVDNYRKEYKYLKPVLFKKPKLAWLEILKEKGYPIFSKQISVILNRIVNAKSKNGLTRWIFGIDTTRFKLTKQRLFLLDKEMKKWPTSIHPDYFKYLDEQDYFFSEKCCNYIKTGLKNLKIPAFVGTMVSESEFRKNSWIQYGCNIFNDKHILSRPLSLFQNKDIWLYIWKNRLDINPKYNFKQTKEFSDSTKDLHYNRLGCISCPYGSHLEAKEGRNRFQVLYEESKLLYETNVIKNGMYKILIDMDIKIPEDKKYMELYNARWEQIKEWYDNFEDKLADIITQIENYNNYKKLKLSKTNKQVVWEYTNDEIYQFFKNYNLNTKKSTIDKLIKKYRSKRTKGR